MRFRKNRAPFTRELLGRRLLPERPTLFLADRGRHGSRPAAALAGPLWEKRKKPKRPREEVAVALRPTLTETELFG